MKLALLYDTWETEFAGDVLGLLHALGLDVRTVVGAPNKGQDLGQKERRVLDECDGWIFLLTPGSERGGVSGFASQSVCDEVGRAEERFKKDPSKVIYLADSEWRPHAICQKALIRFDRRDHRSMTRAYRDLINELKEMGAFVPEPKPQATSDHRRPGGAHTGGDQEGLCVLRGGAQPARLLQAAGLVSAAKLPGLDRGQPTEDGSAEGVDSAGSRWPAPSSGMPRC